jgi:hypothetical protein
LLGNSDVWQTQARGTGGVWWTPTKLKYFNLTLTYENGLLNIFRNGLIDQVIEVKDLTLQDVTLGGFNGWIEDCRIYNRALTQGEVKKLTEISLAYTFNSSLSTEIELESLTFPENIYTDVVLTAKSASGNAVTWASNNTTVVTNAGLVTLPQTTTPVTLTATIGGQSKTFNVNVEPRNIDNNKVFTYTFDAADVYTSDNIRYLKDKSGKDNDATIYGSAVVNGILDLTANTAAGFTTNGYATAPNGMLNNLRSCSFLAKIKPASLASAPRIFDFGSASSNSILLRASAFTAGFKYNGGSTVLINSSTSLTVGQEAKVAMTFDAKTKTTKIFLNGVETASATTFPYEPYQLTTIGANTRNYIGRTQWWDTSVASSNIDFNGTMDDVYLYDIALTASEIIEVQSDATGIGMLKKNGLSIYPNPVMRNEDIQINYDPNPTEMQDLKIEIISMFGETIKVIRPATSPFQITGLSQSGIYLIRVISGANCLYTGKLLVK